MNKIIGAGRFVYNKLLKPPLTLLFLMIKYTLLLPFIILAMAFFIIVGLIADAIDNANLEDIKKHW